MNPLLARAIVSFLVLPGTVAFLVPLAVLAPIGGRPFAGSFPLVLLGAGAVLLAWSVVEFYVAGRGTLAPWAPPQRLVVTGPYRVSRNPMYIAVLLVLSGRTVGFRSLPLGLYTVAVAFAFQLRVLIYEEPRLARAHRENWIRYRDSVPRWLGRR